MKLPKLGSKSNAHHSSSSFSNDHLLMQMTSFHPFAGTGNDSRKENIRAHFPECNLLCRELVCIIMLIIIIIMKIIIIIGSDAPLRKFHGKI